MLSLPAGSVAFIPDDNGEIVHHWALLVAGSRGWGTSVHLHQLDWNTEPSVSCTRAMMSNSSNFLHFSDLTQLSVSLLKAAP
jgi:hypothetical protein